MVLFIEEDSGLPVASLLAGLITVDSPLSCIVSDVGAPVLAVSTPPCVENDRLSGPDSFTFSEITKPHFAQNCSPVTSSVSKEFFPQRVHVDLLLKLSITMKISPALSLAYCSILVTGISIVSAIFLI
jgi:hypothetical protein